MDSSPRPPKTNPTTPLTGPPTPLKGGLKPAHIIIVMDLNPPSELALNEVKGGQGGWSLGEQGGMLLLPINSVFEAL